MPSRCSALLAIGVNTANTVAVIFQRRPPATAEPRQRIPEPAAQASRAFSFWLADAEAYLGVPVLVVGLVGTSGRSPFWPNCGAVLRPDWLTSVRDISPIGCGTALGWLFKVVDASPL